MRISDLVIATMTLARSDDEATMLSRALSRLAAHGRPAVVADGASVPSFRDWLRSHDRLQLVEPSGPGLVSQVRAAIDEAGRPGSRFVLYTEPDKATFFDEHLASFLASAPDDGGIGVVLASRTEAAFETFPPMQRTAETAINRLCAELIGEEGDYSYGPFLLNRRLVPYVHRAGADLGWGWRHFIFTTAARLGMRVVHVPGDFCCPPDQQKEGAEDRLHRLRQLQQNVAGLLLTQHANLPIP